MPSGIYPAGAPVFYPQVGAMPPQARQQAFVYPQQMVAPRARWAPQPGQQRPGYQAMPNYVMPPQRTGTRGQSGRRGSSTGATAGAQQRGGNKPPTGRRQFTYTNNTRGPPPGQIPLAIPGGMMGEMMPIAPEPLTSHRLASATPEERKQMLGDALFPMIHQHQPQHSAKITGMILESTVDTSELVHLLEDPGLLLEKIEEAVGVLKAHNQYDGEGQEGDAEPKPDDAGEGKPETSV